MDNGQACEVCWETRGFKNLGKQPLPTQLIIRNIAALAQLLGSREEQQLRRWQSKISYVLTALSPILSVSDAGTHESVADSTNQGIGAGENCGGGQQQKEQLFNALIDHLDTLCQFNDEDLYLLVKLIPQLKCGMGKGSYLRSLPVTVVDTKFIEKHRRLIESITAAVIDEAARQRGLFRWLNCRHKPRDWLLVKPLCPQTRAALGGLPLLRLSSDTLIEFVLPADNILIIENEQPCLALPDIPNTIAIAGGGKNVAWMQAQWLPAKRVGYWGDIDSEGLSILSDARSKQSTITPLMMDMQTVDAYRQRMVDEPGSVIKEPIALTRAERELFSALRGRRYGHTRLEQERLPIDYVTRAIDLWLT